MGINEFLNSLDKQQYKTFRELHFATQVYRKHIGCERLSEEIMEVMQFGLTSHNKML